MSRVIKIKIYTYSAKKCQNFDFKIYNPESKELYDAVYTMFYENILKEGFNHEMHSLSYTIMYDIYSFLDSAKKEKIYKYDVFAVPDIEKVTVEVSYLNEFVLKI